MLHNNKCVLFIYERYFMSCTIIIDEWSIRLWARWPSIWDWESPNITSHIIALYAYTIWKSWSGFHFYLSKVSEIMQIVRSTPTSYLQIIIKPTSVAVITHDKTVARVQSLQNIIFTSKIIYELIKTKVITA